MMKHAYYLIILSCLLSLSCNGNGGHTIKPTLVSMPKNKAGYYENLGFKYSTIEEADIKLAAKLDSLYKEDPSYYLHNITHYEMIDIIMNDPASFSYDFPKMQDHISFITSDDGKLRLYYWDTGMGGTMIDYGNLCQFESNGRVYAYCCGVYDLYDDAEYISCYGGCNIGDIYTIKADNGETFYLVHTIVHESSLLGGSVIIPLKIENDRLVIAPIFDSYPDEYGFNCTQIEYDFGDWFFKANYGEGWDWFYRYDEKNQTFYIPAVDDLCLTDRYNLYKFNGERFEFLREDGGYWLHPSIRNFKQLETLFVTKDYKVRVDLMEDDTYRYSCWKRYDSMDKKPDLVIYNGTYIEDGRCYSFKNDDYEYAVITSNSGCRLSVLHGLKLVLLQEQITYPDYED